MSLPSLRSPPFAPAVKAALDALLAAPDTGRRVAVFDWDGTCATGDVADAALVRLLRGLTLRLGSEGLAAALPRARIGEVGYTLASGANLDAEVEGIVGAARWLEARGWTPGTPGDLVGTAGHRRLAEGLWRVHRELEQTPAWGPRVAYGLDAKLLAGHSPEELHRLAMEVSAAPRPRGRLAGEGVGGLTPRLYPGIRGLVAALLARGFEVWVVSGSHEALVVGLGVGLLGLPRGCILGTRTQVMAGHHTIDLAEMYPVTWGPAKVEVIRRHIGAAPLLVAGDTEGDRAMLTSFPETRVRLLLPKRPGALGDLVAQAGRGGYVVQPRDPVTGAWRRS